MFRRLELLRAGEDPTGSREHRIGVVELDVELTRGDGIETRMALAAVHLDAE